MNVHYSFMKVEDPTQEDLDAGPSVNVSIEIEANEDITHTELTEVFERFLRACGYRFEGHFILSSEDREHEWNC